MTAGTASPPVPALRFQSVTKTYGGSQVLDRLELTVAKGEFFALVGLNGAGKTTLIKSLLDLCDIEDGNISIFDVRHRRSESRRRLVFLPEDFRPPYFLTGRDFLRYACGLYGSVYQDAQARALMAALELETAALRRSVRDLSRGMAQKLGLVACLLGDKDLLVLDEPMSSLDPKARCLLREYLLGLKAEGKTLFFSTHLLSDVEALCDRIGVLHGGRLRFVGTPQECCRRYQGHSLEAAFLKCIEG
ncbi:MAG: ABC transporter ATP-binding protein [Gammaproteobacteria bacterium]|nr:ABC transporter ATP-binding protein [Gammaproteobacteria bacterium]